MKNFTLFTYIICLATTSQTYNQKAIVVGASTGIGREIAKVLAHYGYELGLCSRKIDLLNVLARELPTKSWTKKIDLMDADNIQPLLQELVDEMGGLDLIVVNSGIWPEGQQGMLPQSKQIPFEWIRETIAVNVTGCAAAFNFAFNYFMKHTNGFGHIVGISSTDAVRGNAVNPSYCASKSFMAVFLEGMRNKCAQLAIPMVITEIRPGWIQTTPEMMMDPDTQNYAYWVAPSTQAAQDVYRAIAAKKKVAYVPQRWALIGLLLGITPDWLYNKIGGV